LVKSRGADEVFDYNDPECAAKIRTFTENKLKYVWDTMGEMKFCCEALSTDSAGCFYSTIVFDDDPFPRKDVNYTETLMYTMFGEGFQKYGNDYPASKDDYEFGKMWMDLTEKLVAEGKLKPHPKRLVPGGLEGILKGMEELKAEKVRGEKLIYRI
jgi:NADPH:quinone reductase-like Zn-dependent oxidoreductase